MKGIFKTVNPRYCKPTREPPILTLKYVQDNMFRRFMLDMIDITKCPLQLNESNSVSLYMKSYGN